MGKFFTAVLLMIVCYRAVAQESSEDDYRLIKDLRQEWLAIDKNNQYVPFVARDQNNPSVIGVRLDLDKYSGNHLRCCIPATSSILINKQILTSVKQKRCLVYDIDSLQQAYGEHAILLTVYQPDNALDQVSLQIVNNSTTMGSPKDMIALRTLSASKNFFVLGLIGILTLYAILINNFPKTFKNVYNLQKILAFRAREEDMRIRLVSEPHIFFLVQHCLLVAFLLVILVPDIGTRVPFIRFSLQSLGDYLLIWLTLSIAILFVVWIKYMLVVMFGTLFKLRHLMYLHMFDFMRLSLMFWGAVFLLAICVYYNVSVGERVYSQILIYLFIAFALARVIVLYLRLFRNASFKNMYLFSYICTAEIIPLFIGLELLVG